MTEKIVIDATNATLGRLASYAAKQALLGRGVVIVNCDSTVISGKPKSVLGEYREKRSKGGSSLMGPFFPKSPERIVKRTIRGMLSYKQGRGREAFGRIMCYNGIPIELKEAKKILAGKEKKTRVSKLSEVCKDI